MKKTKTRSNRSFPISAPLTRMKASVLPHRPLESFLRAYVRARPLFLSLIRAKEAYLYQEVAPFQGPMLDVGCGDGFFASVALSQQVQGEIIGLDLDDSRIRESEYIGIYNNTTTFDGIHIPFSDGYFPSVVSNCVLEHVADISALMSDIYRVVKPGGIFLTTVMAQPWEDHLVGSMVFGHSYTSWMRKKQVHVNLFSEKTWDDTFSSVGFHIEKKIGYLSPRACQMMDICHYLSVPSLISYLMCGKWVLFPSFVESFTPIRWISSSLAQNVSPSESGAILYLLRKSV